MMSPEEIAEDVEAMSMFDKAIASAKKSLRESGVSITYTTIGSVRGGCGHNHRSIRTAVDCITRDHAGCKTQTQGGYSDRSVQRTDGEDLNDDELYTISLFSGE